MRSLFDVYNKKIRYVMDNVQKDIYIINLFKENKCTCLHSGSSEPNPRCKKCLGTGYRIKIKKAKGVLQDSDLASTIRSSSQTIVAKNCYLLEEYSIGIDDLIISEDYILLVNEIKEYRSRDNEVIYRRCFCVDKKYYTEDFINNFNAIVHKDEGGEKA